jgi:hypothetical protein
MEPNAESGSYPEGASCVWQNCFTLVSKPRWVTKSLEDVFALQVGIILKKLFYSAAGADLAD